MPVIRSSPAQFTLMIGDRERTWMLGMDGYLAKPLDARLLSQTLAELSELAPVPSVPEKKILDRAASLVRVGGDEELLSELINTFSVRLCPDWLEDVRQTNIYR